MIQNHRARNFFITFRIPHLKQLSCVKNELNRIYSSFNSMHHHLDINGDWSWCTSQFNYFRLGKLIENGCYKFLMQYIFTV